MYTELVKGIKRILIIKLSSIGDVVHSLPTLGALRQRFPRAYIAWVVEEKSKDILIDHPNLDEVIVFNKEQYLGHLRSLRLIKLMKDVRDFICTLRHRGFDIAIDLQGLAKSAIIAYLSGAPLRMGYKHFKEFSFLFINVRVPVNRNAHAVERYLAFAKFLGASVKSKDFQIWLSEDDKRFAQLFLEQNQVNNADILIGINPGATWQSKQWSLGNFAKLADELIEKYGARPLIFGGLKDIPAALEIAKSMQHQPIIAAGKTTLKQLCALLKRCKLLITVDSGPMHIAAALNIPVIALFGPTDPRLVGPYGENHTVLKHSVPCGPCRDRNCYPNRCMELITVEEVMRAAEAKIERAKSYV